MRFAVIATGQSLTDEQVQAVRSLPCVAVSNAYEKAPWAMALASSDRGWWRHYKPDFKGLKFSVGQVLESEVAGVERIGLIAGSNSGLLGMEVAVHLGATSLILLGFDMKGTHYFGPHQGSLRNTTAHRFEAFKRDLANFKKVPVINCTPDSALECFPKMDLACALRLP